MVDSLEAWQHGFGNAAPAISMASCRAGIVIHYQEAWWFCFRMAHSSDRGEGLLTSSSIELRSSRLRTPERMPV